MANPYEAYPMVLNGIFIGMISLRKDQKDYFGIQPATAAEKALVSYVGSIKAHKRQIYSNRLDDTTPTKTKDIPKNNAVERVRRKITNSKGGKPIKVPTELTSTPINTSTAQNAPARTPQIRFTTIKFPGAANNAEISAWINSKMTAKKPTYFKTPAGASFPVVALAAGVTPEGTPTPP